MKVALYIRVSKDEQKTDRQHDDLKKYCADNGHDIVAIFEDKQSGLRRIRSSLTELLGRVNEFEAVIVWSYDRLTRDDMQALELKYYFKSCNVRLISFTEGEIKCPMTELLHTIKAGVSKYESAVKSQRIRSGLQARRSRGFKLGAKRRLDYFLIRYYRGLGLKYRQIKANTGASLSAIQYIVLGVRRGKPIEY